MKDHWLDIQSFHCDQKILVAIDDLSIALKFQSAGLEDSERTELANNARVSLRGFLRRLKEVAEEAEDDVVRGVDPRFKELADAFCAARSDRGNFDSTLMKNGIDAVLQLLDADRPHVQRELLDSLAELRRIVEGHQHTLFPNAIGRTVLLASGQANPERASCHVAADSNVG